MMSQDNCENRFNKYLDILQFGYYMKESNKSYHIDEMSQDIQNNDQNFVAMATFSVPVLSK